MAADRLGGLDSDPVVRLIAVRQIEVVGLELHVDERLDELPLHHRPDDAGHLVAVHLDDRVARLDARSGAVHRSISSREKQVGTGGRVR
jgi:hypothetical protein